MKKIVAILLVMQLLLMAGCSLPFFGKTSKEPLADVDEYDFIRATEDESTSKPADSDTETPTDTTDETTGDATGVINEETDEEVPRAPLEEDILPTQSSDTDEGTGVLSSSITTERDEEFTKTRLPVTIYYQDKDGYLIPMTRWIMLQQGIARAAISLDIDSPINREETAYYGVYPVIPSGTEILGIDIRDGVATIDFSRHFLNYKDAKSESNLVASVVYTLTEFKTIDEVRILVNGYLQGEMRFGTDISEALGREDIYINSGQLQFEDGLDKTDVYLFKKANEGFTYLAPISVEASGFVGEMPEILIKQLLDTDSVGGLTTQMPQGVELLDYNMENGLLTLNFSDGFIDDRDAAKQDGILKQLAYTIKQVNGITGVRVLVEGRRIELPEGFASSLGLAIPKTINDVMDR